MDYLGVGPEGQDHQVEVLGIQKPEDLFKHLPKSVLFPHFDLAPGLDEQGLHRFFDDLCEEPGVKMPVTPGKSFLGGGYYHHFIPSSVNAITSDGSFSTAYTPYQAEASQGTLQALFEYQTYMAELLQMEVVNASHYDGAAALAEAIRLAYFHAGGTTEQAQPGSGKELAKKRKVLVAGALHPEYREVIKTYTDPLHMIVRYEDNYFDNPAAVTFDDDLCAVVSVSPDFYGRIHDLNGLAEKIHGAGALFIAHTDPLACTIIEPPGNVGADIVTAEGQPLGIPVSFGGPYLGVFAVTKALIRRMPGRLCGETKDSRGQRMYVLTLSTREQHIRREKAVSNICTNQGLMALRSLAYMATMGTVGMSRAATHCIQKIDSFRKSVASIPGITVLSKGVLFRDCLLELPVDANELCNALGKRGFEAGLPLGKYFPGRNKELLVSMTEVHRDSDIADFLTALGQEIMLLKKEGK